MCDSVYSMYESYDGLNSTIKGWTYYFYINSMNLSHGWSYSSRLLITPEFHQLNFFPVHFFHYSLETGKEELGAKAKYCCLCYSTGPRFCFFLLNSMAPQSIISRYYPYSMTFSSLACNLIYLSGCLTVSERY